MNVVSEGDAVVLFLTKPVLVMMKYFAYVMYVLQIVSSNFLIIAFMR